LSRTIFQHTSYSFIFKHIYFGSGSDPSGEAEKGIRVGSGKVDLHHRAFRKMSNENRTRFPQRQAGILAVTLGTKSRTKERAQASELEPYSMSYFDGRELYLNRYRDWSWNLQSIEFDSHPGLQLLYS
jgi:hypothetical protein